MPIENEHRLTAVEDMAKSNRRRIEELEKRQDDLDKIVNTVGILAEKMRNIEAIATETKLDVKSIKEKPGKRWESVVEKIILTTVVAVVSFLLAKGGL